MRAKIKDYLLKRIIDQANGSLNIFCNSGDNKYSDDIDDWFVTKHGVKLPIFKNYRYSVKKGWLGYNALNILYELNAKKILSASSAQFLKEIAGHRTLTKPLLEADELLKSLIPEIENRFIPLSLNGRYRIALKPSAGEIKKRIQIHAKAHKNLFNKLKAFNLYQSSGKEEILEIGYITGGYSLFAFEELGFNVTGIDSFYSGMNEKTCIHQYISESINSKINFRLGDITKHTEFATESFDIVYTASVLEHIRDIETALAEMYRILKPGGVIIHNYNPFFCPNGGHALGVLDSPWAHVRLDLDDYNRYILESRPYEKEMAKEWINNALNTKLSKSFMHQCLINTQFEILYFQMTPPTNPNRIAGLSSEVLKDCFRNFPEITIDDLISENILVIAQKK